MDIYQSIYPEGIDFLVCNYETIVFLPKLGIKILFILKIKISSYNEDPCSVRIYSLLLGFLNDYYLAVISISSEG